jgi:uncharacterized LabA/DUF88 family protein
MGDNLVDFYIKSIDFETMYKTALFIDGGYLAKISKSFGQPKIDFLAFSELLCNEDDDRLRTYYYYCMPFQSPLPSAEESYRYKNAERFVKSLAKLSKFEVRLGRFQKIQNASSTEYVQKGIDVMLAVDLVKMSWGKLIDKAILLTADSDFVYAIQAVKDAGILTKLCYSDKYPVNESMLDVFDERVTVTNDLLNLCIL